MMARRREKERFRCCLFCGSTKTTKEHLWGAWTHAYHPKSTQPLQRGNHTITKQNPDGVFTKRPGVLRRPGNGIFQTTRVPCAECNNGWMSAIERNMKEIFNRVFWNSGEQIDRYEAVAMRKWVYLKTLLLLAAQDYSVEYDRTEWFKRRNDIDYREKMDAEAFCKSTVVTLAENFRKSEEVPNEVSTLFCRYLCERGQHNGSHNLFYQMGMRPDGFVVFEFSTVLFLTPMAVIIRTTGENFNFPDSGDDSGKRPYLIVDQPACGGLLHSERYFYDSYIEDKFLETRLAEKYPDGAKRFWDVI